MQTAFPQLALRHDFLRYAMFAIASLHLQHLDPSCQDSKLVAANRTKALSSFHKAVAGFQGAFAENYEAILLMSAMILVLCPKEVEDGELAMYNTMALTSGLGFIVHLRRSDVPTMTIGPLFVPIKDHSLQIPFIPTNLLSYYASMDPEDPEFQYIASYKHALEHLGILYAAVLSDGAADSTLLKTISWVSANIHPTNPFLRLLKQRKPWVLVLSAYYLQFTHLTDKWWFQGLARRDVGIISKTLGPEWQDALKIPLLVVSLDSKEDIIKIILSSWNVGHVQFVQPKEWHGAESTALRLFGV